MRAIGQDARIDTLLRCPKWTINDVHQTMQQHDLTVTEDGRVVKKPGVREDLLHLANHSPSRHVRESAAAAVVHLRRLRDALDQHSREVMAQADRAAQCRAVEQWRDWLKTATQEATAELRRLRPRRPTTKEAPE